MRVLLKPGTLACRCRKAKPALMRMTHRPAPDAGRWTQVQVLTYRGPGGACRFSGFSFSAFQLFSFSSSSTICSNRTTAASRTGLRNQRFLEQTRFSSILQRGTQLRKFFSHAPHSPSSLFTQPSVLTVFAVYLEASSSSIQRPTRYPSRFGHIAKA